MLRLERDCGEIISWNISNTSKCEIWATSEVWETRPGPPWSWGSHACRDQLKLFIPKKLFFICCLMFYLLHLLGIINSEVLWGIISAQNFKFQYSSTSVWWLIKELLNFFGRGGSRLWQYSPDCWTGHRSIDTGLAVPLCPRILSRSHSPSPAW